MKNTKSSDVLISLMVGFVVVTRAVTYHDYNVFGTQFWALISFNTKLDRLVHYKSSSLNSFLKHSPQFR